MTGDALALGVWAAYVYHQRRDLWPALQRAARLLVAPGLAVVASVPWLPPDVLNRFAYAGVALAFLAVLVLVADREDLPFASSRAVRFVALTSYSVYMTHTTVLDVAGRTPLAALPRPLFVGVALAGVWLAGALFYRAVEVPTLRLRQRVAPRRDDRPSPALAAA